MSIGKVYLVGAGPGDPRLITVMGLELIKKADVIVYDFLINKELLTNAKEGAELICAGKSHSYHTMEQEDINKLLAEKAKEADIVVRLKNGDPFVFGRGAEEIHHLKNENVPYQIIPGLSSSIAVPSSCGLPLTHREYSASVAIMTGHRRKGEDFKLVNADTLVFVMAVTNLEHIVNRLIESGRGADTPCALIERGTFEGQKISTSTLKDIVEESKKSGIKPPAIFVVGDVVGFYNMMN
ncbi:uroporphyrinogen-III C-methyltransferase [Thermodesulfobacteriota bacterium]